MAKIAWYLTEVELRLIDTWRQSNKARMGRFITRASAVREIVRDACIGLESQEVKSYADLLATVESNARRIAALEAKAGSGND